MDSARHARTSAKNNMETVISLIRETDSLLANPTQYAVKSFQCFLQNQDISKDDFGVWALAKPCQMIPLAKIVTERTECLAIFRILAKAPEFVNAVLEVGPLWLEDLLSGALVGARATSSLDDLHDSAAILLSSSFKSETLLASILSWIRNAALSVVRSPSEASLRRLSGLYAALQSNLLDVFSEDILIELSCRCKNICSRSTETTNDIEIMLAQDILAQLATALQAPHTPSKSSLETPPGAQFSEVCRRRIFKLFTGVNASTTLKLTILRLSMFCSEERGFSPLVALEGLSLAKRIMTPIPMLVRQQWMAKNSKLTEKFLSRLNREALDANVRLEGVNLLVAVFGVEIELLSSLKQVACDALIALCDSHRRVCWATLTTNHKAITDILACLCPSRDSAKSTGSAERSVLVRMMTFVVEQCQPWHANAVNTALKFRQATLILTALQNALHRPGVEAYIVSFIQLGYVPEWWDSEIVSTSSFQFGDAENCIDREVCSRALDRLRSDLAANFSSLLLTAAWQSNTSLQIPEVCERLLNRLKGSSAVPSNLPHCRGTDPIMGLEDAGVSTEAHRECEELREKLRSLEAQRITVESQLEQSKKILENKQTARHALQKYLDDAEREYFDTSKVLQAARDDYKELLQEADRRIKALDNDFLENEMVVRAEFCAREAKLEDEAEDALCKLKWKDEELQREKENRANFAAEMEVALAHSNVQIEQLRLAVAEKDKALEEAGNLKGRLVALLGGRLD